MKLYAWLAVASAALALAESSSAQISADVHITGVVSNRVGTFNDPQYGLASVPVGSIFDLRYRVNLAPDSLPVAGVAIYSLASTPVVMTVGAAGETNTTPIAASSYEMQNDVAQPFGGDLVTSEVLLASGIEIIANAASAPNTLLTSEFLEINGSFSTAGLSSLISTVMLTEDPSNPASALLQMNQVNVSVTVPTNIGTVTCVAQPTFLGVPSELRAFGSTAVAQNDVTLAISEMPPLFFGIALASRIGMVTTPVGQGTLCLGGNIGRYTLPGEIFQADAQGQATFPIDVTAIRQSSSNVAAVAGDTWYFQAWLRDLTPTGAATSNFTNAVSVLFN